MSQKLLSPPAPPPDLSAATEEIVARARSFMEEQDTFKKTEARQPFFPFPNPAMKTATFELLKLHSIDKVEIRFDGSGDSGQVEEISFYRGEEVLDSADPIYLVTFPYRTRHGQTMHEGKWQHIEKLENISFKDALDQMCCDATDVATEVDWCNNDGGFGLLTLRVTPEPSIHLDISQRVTTTEDYEFDLTNGARDA